MANFEHKPGSVSIFKNDRKERDNQPDYSGKGKDLDGNEIQIALWIKEGRNGKFFSGKISHPRQQTGQQESRGYGQDDSDWPF